MAVIKSPNPKPVVGHIGLTQGYMYVYMYIYIYRAMEKNKEITIQGPGLRQDCRDGVRLADGVWVSTRGCFQTSVRLAFRRSRFL